MLNEEDFFNLLFWAVKPGPRGFPFCDRHDDAMTTLEQMLSEMENTPSQCTPAQFNALRDKLNTAIVMTEKGYYAAGVQFSARFLLSALAETS